MRTSFVRGGSYSVEKKKGKNKPCLVLEFGLFYVLKVFGELYRIRCVYERCVCLAHGFLNLPAKKDRSKEKTEAMCA